MEYYPKDLVGRIINLSYPLEEQKDIIFKLGKHYCG